MISKILPPRSLGGPGPGPFLDIQYCSDVLENDHLFAALLYRATFVDRKDGSSTSVWRRLRQAGKLATSAASLDDADDHLQETIAALGVYALHRACLYIQYMQARQWARCALRSPFRL